jgi:hypothetical protein
MLAVSVLGQASFGGAACRDTLCAAASISLTVTPRGFGTARAIVVCRQTKKGSKTILKTAC